MYRSLVWCGVVWFGVYVVRGVAWFGLIWLAINLGNSGRLTTVEVLQQISNRYEN